MKKKRSLLLHPMLWLITTFVIYIVVLSVKQLTKPKYPDTPWTGLYTVTDTFTDSAARLITEIPEDELYAVPVKVVHILKGAYNGYDYYFQNLNNRTELFKYNFSTEDGFKKYQTLWIFFSSNGMSQHKKSITTTKVSSSIGITVDDENRVLLKYWDIKLQRSTDRNQNAFPHQLTDYEIDGTYFTQEEKEHLER